MSRDRSYIEDNENILEGFINAFKDIGFIIDEEGRYIEVFYSKETEPLLYRDKQDILDRKVEDLFPEDTAQNFLSAIKNSIEKDGLETLEYKLDVKDGSRWFEARIHPLPKNRGTPQVIWIARDITEQKQREKNLQRYKTLIEEIPDGVVMVDEDGKYTYVNEKASGPYSPKDWIGKSVSSLSEHYPISEEIVSEHQKAINNILNGNKKQETHTFTISHPEFGELILEAMFSLVENSQGEKLGVVGVARDITEKEKNRKQLQKEREKYSNLVEQSHDGVLVVQDKKIVFLNPSFEEITGYNKEELLGTDFTELIHPESKQKVTKYYRERMKGESPPNRYQLKMIDKNNKEKVLEINASCIQYDGGPAVMANLRDITQQKRYERELEQKTDQLDILNRIIRHDIRNDINVIDLYLESLIKESKQKNLESIVEDLEKIQGRSRHVNDLTKVSRDLAQTITENEQAELEEIKLNKILKEEIENTKNSFKNSKINIQDTPKNIKVQANKMLTSVIRNILNNAIQHNDKETPKIEVSIEEKQNTVIVSIADNGPGIPDELKEVVFGKGEKSMDSTGTGIGLYLVKELVDRYNGDVWIEDNQPTGSIFKVELQKT